MNKRLVYTSIIIAILGGGIAYFVRKKRVFLKNLSIKFTGIHHFGYQSGKLLVIPNIEISNPTSETLTVSSISIKVSEIIAGGGIGKEVFDSSPQNNPLTIGANTYSIYRPKLLLPVFNGVSLFLGIEKIRGFKVEVTPFVGGNALMPLDFNLDLNPSKIINLFKNK